MKRNHLLTFVLILGISTLAEAQNRPPNILLILVDDLGFGDLECQGAKDMKTPHINKFASQGMTCTNFYANSTVCSPSRASLLTGRYPDMVGVPGVIRQNEDNSWGYLSEEAILQPQVLNAKGYKSAIIGKWHLGLEEPNIPTARGFDFFKGFLGDMMNDYWDHLRKGINWMRLNEKEINPEGHATDLFTEWSIEYLEKQAASEQPFYLYLAYNAPHFPIQPPQEWLNTVLEREIGIDMKRAKNVAFIEHLDNSIGMVMQALEDTGLIENTIVIFTSDNGGALRYAQSNGELRGGKQDMYEGGIKVPAFVQWKGKISPGTSTDNLMMLMDLFPTFCEIAGVNLYHEIDGISILPTLLGNEQITDDRTVFWVRREGGHYGGQSYFAARTGEHKILQNTPFEAIQYFNLRTDKLENAPLETKEDKIYKDLRDRLKEHIRATGAVKWQN